MKITLADGFIASNIGNAFYNLSLYECLLANFSEHSIDRVSDLSLNYDDSSNENHYNIIENIDTNLVIFTGPIFSEKFSYHYSKTFKIFEKRGIDIGFISTGGFTYSNKEVNSCTEFLQSINFRFIITRDDLCFNIYSRRLKNVYQGICSGWLLPLYFSYNNLKIDNPFYTFCFDSIVEPKFYNFKTDESFSTKYLPLSNTFLSNRRSFSLAGKASYYLYNRYFGHKLPNIINNHKIIRPTHTMLSRPIDFVFSKTNSFFSELATDYIKLYSNTSLTLTDRVHAALCTACYGKPFRLLTKSKRSLLFEPLGLKSINANVNTINMQLLAEKQNSFITKICKVISNL